ncbi:unnamed protein product [Larinioides sclopetarius]
MDAELQEKTFSDLKKLGELIKNSCDKAMKEHQEKAENEDEAVPKKRGRERGPTFKVGGVSVNAKTLYANESELQPLDIIIPADKEERKKWVLKEHVKDAHFDMPWTPEDDSNLLKGVYEHGMGNWESIKMDYTLGLVDKILPDGEQKPQAKNLQARCDYLLKVLKRMTDVKPGLDVPKAKRGRKPRADKVVLSKAFVDNDDSDASVNSTPTKENKPRVKKIKSESTVLDDKSNKEHLSPVTKPPTLSDLDTEVKKKKSDKTEKPKKTKDKEKISTSQSSTKEKKKNKVPPAMHITANAEPQVIDNTERELKEEVFKACKEQMRPVKKYLMALDFKDEPLSAEDKTKLFSQYLLKIGRKISEILKGYQDPAKVKEWRSNLWIFVSHFTEQDAKQLYKIYRQALRDLELARPPASVTDTKKGNEKTENKATHDTSPKQGLDKHSSKHRPPNHPMKRHADEDSSKKSDRPMKKKYSDNSSDRKMAERRDRYSNDYNKRDHYRSYSRDEGSNFRGKPHNRDYPYPQDRHNNRYHSGGNHGGFSHYNMHQSSYGAAQQPPPAHSGYNYGARPPVHSPSSQPPPGVGEHHGDSYSSYQGHADSWRRRDEHRKDHGSRDYKIKNQP